MQSLQQGDYSQVVQVLMKRSQRSCYERLGLAWLASFLLAVTLQGCVERFIAGTDLPFAVSLATPTPNTGGWSANAVWVDHFSHRANQSRDIAMDPEALREFVARVARPKHVCTKTEVSMLRKLLIASHAYDFRQAEAHIREHPHTAVALNYLCDGWSCYTKSEHMTSAEGLSVKRVGRVRNEYLLEQAYMRSKGVDKESVVFFLTRVPRPLTQGKSATNITVAAVEFFGLLRDKGHRGICAVVYIMDGLFSKACKRHLRAYHSMSYENVENSDLDKFGALMGLMDWNLHLSCKAHPMQNSVIWGLKFLTSPEISKDTHLTLKCFRTCATNTND